MNDFHHLKYIRGYVVSEKRIQVSNDWEEFYNNNYHFYFHSRTRWAYIEESGSWICIIGAAVDIYNNTIDLDRVAKYALSYYRYSNDKFYQYIEKLSGRYVVIVGHKSDAIVLADATGMKGVFYHQNQKIVSSHAKLIAELATSDLEPKINSKWLRDYTSYQYPGNYTSFQNVRFLVPNHHLNLKSYEIKRYFPREPLEIHSTAHFAEKIIPAVEKQVELLSKQHKFIFSLSAGNDSRTSLSFMKDYLGNTEFFTFYSTDSNNPEYKGIDILNLDQQVAKDISNNLNLNHRFIIIDNARRTDEDFLKFKEVISENTYLSHNYLLAKSYLDHFGTDKYLHLRSTLYEVGRSIFRINHKFQGNIASTTDLIRCYSRNAVNDENVKGIIDEYNETFSPNNQFNYDPYDLVYWENRMGAWHSQVVTESDVSHDTHILVNSQELLKWMLSVPQLDRREDKLFQTIMEKKWPVIRFWQINNKHTLLDKYDTQIDEYGYSLNDFVVNGFNALGNELPIFSKVTDHRAKFYMLESAPKKGDYVSASLDINVAPDSSYDLVVNLRSPYENPSMKGRLKYQIFLNEELVCEEDIACWKETNQVIIPFATSERKVNFTVKVISIRDCEPWSWGKSGTIIIERVVLRKGNRENRNLIISSPFSKVSQKAQNTI